MSPPRPCAARSAPWSARSCPSSATPSSPRWSTGWSARRAAAGRRLLVATSGGDPGRGDAAGRGADRLAAGRRDRGALRRHLRRAARRWSATASRSWSSTGRSTMAARSTRSRWTMSPPPARGRSACWRWAIAGCWWWRPSTAIGNIRERVAGIDDGDRRRARRAGRADRGRLRADAIAAGGDGAVWRASPLPTAIFTLNNVLTLGHAQGRRRCRRCAIPDDVSLLGFDDYDWMEVFRPPLCAIRQPVAEMAHAAWERLAVLTGATPMGEAPDHMPRPAALQPRLARLGGATPGVRIGRAPTGRGAAAMTGRTDHDALPPDVI